MIDAVFKIAAKSLWNRRSTAGLTLASIAMSTILLMGIERIRISARESFAATLSGVDLIVGSRTGPINLLLYSVFRVGNATHNVSYAAFKEIETSPHVAWSFPISLGDSHKGFGVVGTTLDYFVHYRYGERKSLNFAQGRQFKEAFDIVLGSAVAETLGYRLGQNIALAHGTGDGSFQEHDNHPFVIVGILSPTGTPVDRSLHIPLEGMTALHGDWVDGAPPLAEQGTVSDALKKRELTPESITAFFLGLRSKTAIFDMQRSVNNFTAEPLMAILPGVSLRDMWQTLVVGETALFVISFCVFAVSLLGMVAALLASLNERRREIALLRSVGAGKSWIFCLLLIETGGLGIFGVLMGAMGLEILFWLSQPYLESRMGLSLGLLVPSPREYLYGLGILAGAVCSGLIPGWRLYRLSLGDGLMLRL